MECKPPVKTASASLPRIESRKGQLHMKLGTHRKDHAQKTIPLEEILIIDVKPGWKKGTKITFRDGRI